MSAASSPWTARQAGLAVALLVLLIGFGILSPGFRSPEVLLDQSRYWVEIGILAPFALLVIVAGGIDLSVASILALSGVTLVRLHAEEGLPIAWAAAAGLLLGALAGAVNGALIVLARIPDLVVTLATMAIFRGLAQAVAGNRVHSDLPAGYRFLGEGVVGWLPVQWVLLVASWALAFGILHWTRLGRETYAVGSSARAAAFAGVAAGRTRILLYTLSGLSAAAAAIIYTARSNTARSDDALGYELDVITCVVLGGASISGGRGSVPGLVLGVLVVGALRTGLILTAVPELYQRITTGTVLIVMAAVNERIGRGRGA